MRICDFQEETDPNGLDQNDYFIIDNKNPDPNKDKGTRIINASMMADAFLNSSTKFNELDARLTNNINQRTKINMAGGPFTLSSGNIGGDASDWSGRTNFGQGHLPLRSDGSVSSPYYVLVTGWFGYKADAVVDSNILEYCDFVFNMNELSPNDDGRGYISRISYKGHVRSNYYAPFSFIVPKNTTIWFKCKEHSLYKSSTKIPFTYDGYYSAIEFEQLM